MNEVEQAGPVDTLKQQADTNASPWDDARREAMEALGAVPEMEAEEPNGQAPVEKGDGEEQAPTEDKEK